MLQHEQGVMLKCRYLGYINRLVTSWHACSWRHKIRYNRHRCTSSNDQTWIKHMPRTSVPSGADCAAAAAVQYVTTQVSVPPPLPQTCITIRVQVECRVHMGRTAWMNVLLLLCDLIKMMTSYILFSCHAGTSSKRVEGEDRSCSG